LLEVNKKTESQYSGKRPDLHSGIATCSSPSDEALQVGTIQIRPRLCSHLRFVTCISWCARRLLS